VKGGRFIAEFGHELTRAAADLKASTLSPVDIEALRSTLGPVDMRNRLAPEELAAVLVDLRRPGLTAVALAELLTERGA
jgi:hypothetical protein